MGVNNQLYLGVGHVSLDENLGAFYQDFAPAIYHFENSSLGGGTDEFGIPYLIQNGQRIFHAGYLFQFGLIQHQLVLEGNMIEDRKNLLLKCIEILMSHSEVFHDSIVWRNEPDMKYDLNKGWTSAMYQGQAMSFFLRMGQLFNDKEYIDIAEKIFLFFQYDYAEGGATRRDENGFLWLEEYPTDPPSFVLNGYIYALLGILDLYRATKNQNAKIMYDECVLTIKSNVHKYDASYWSVYDQLKCELVSFYYQKNVHIPLLSILYLLTNEEVFDFYAKKWKRQLDNKYYYYFVKIMYRIQPRIKKLKNII